MITDEMVHDLKSKMVEHVRHNYPALHSDLWQYASMEMMASFHTYLNQLIEEGQIAEIEIKMNGSLGKSVYMPPRANVEFRGDRFGLDMRWNKYCVLTHNPDKGKHVKTKSWWKRWFG